MIVDFKYYIGDRFIKLRSDDKREVWVVDCVGITDSISYGGYILEERMGNYKKCGVRWGLGLEELEQDLKDKKLLIVEVADG